MKFSSILLGKTKTKNDMIYIFRESKDSIDEVPAISGSNAKSMSGSGHKLDLMLALSNVNKLSSIFCEVLFHLKTN